MLQSLLRDAFDDGDRPRPDAVAIVVLGAHRSGTSAMTRTLSLAGAALPSDLLSPHPAHNPRGFWESRAVVLFNEAILRARGGSWDRPPGMPADETPDKLVEGAISVLSDQWPNAAALLLKDPRLSLLAPLWDRAIRSLGRRPVYVVMTRRPEEVAASLNRRNGLPFEQGLAIWAAYMRRADIGTRWSSRLFVAYDDLLDDWRGVVGRVATLAGAAMTGPANEAAADAFLSRDLKRQTSAGDAAPCMLGACNLTAIYDALVAAPDGESDPETRLDDAWATFAAEERRPSDGRDARAAYNLFLGREPESEAAVAGKLNLDCAALAAAFLNGPEFGRGLADCIMAEARPRGGLFDAPPAPGLARWAAERLPLTLAGRRAAAASRDWPQLLHAVLADPDFQAKVARKSPASTQSFLGRLHALRERASGGGRRDPASPVWALVTGAPRSGTSLFRALLNEHPNVALLQEYGLTTLVERIEAIVGRPAAKEEDWDSPGEPDDLAFNDVAAFYRDRPGRDAITRGGGDLRREHFGAVSAGIFAAIAPDKTLRVVGDKMPLAEPWENLPLLLDHLGELRFLIVVRNPVDVVRSSLIRRAAARRGRDVWPVEGVQQAAAQWVDAWRATLALRRRFPGKAFVVKYDDLCGETQATMARVYAFLELAPHAPRAPIAALPATLRLHSDDEQAVLDNLLGGFIADWPERDIETLMRDHAQLPEPYLFGRRIAFGEDSASPFLVSGFSHREDWGRWTEGPAARIEIRHGEPRGLLLVEIWIVKAFVGDRGGADLVVQTGRGEPRLFTLDGGSTRLAFLSRAEDAVTPGQLEIDILIPRPKTTGEPPPDPRALGVAIGAMTVTRLNDRGAT